MQLNIFKCKKLKITRHRGGARRYSYISIEGKENEESFEIIIFAATNEENKMMNEVQIEKGGPV